MPDPAALTGLAQEALLLALSLSLPAVGIATLVGLLVAVLQAATQIQDATLAHLPRIVVVAVALAISGPWIAGHIANFALRAWHLR